MKGGKRQGTRESHAIMDKPNEKQEENIDKRREKGGNEGREGNGREQGTKRLKQDNKLYYETGRKWKQKSLLNEERKEGNEKENNKTGKKERKKEEK